MLASRIVLRYDCLACLKKKKRSFKSSFPRTLPANSPNGLTPHSNCWLILCALQGKKNQNKKQETNCYMFFVEIYLESFLIVKSFRNNNQWYVILVLLAKSFLLNFQDVVKWDYVSSTSGHFFPSLCWYQSLTSTVSPGIKWKCCFPLRWLAAV